MPESILEKKVFSLAEVTASIKNVLADRYKSTFWVKAEMNKLNHYSHSGHCYPDLLEKQDGKVVAQMRANLWKADYLRINNQFLQILKEPLKDGIRIMFLASVQFDASYGLSLRIHDIDPSFALGELEREKQETIERLTKEGIFRQNKTLPLPLLPQRIAVISVETSKGYADFINVLESNKNVYKFFLHLFPALLQGDRSVDSIIEQLNRIRKVMHHFDAVAIIRGGGGDVGLSSYNHYTLSRAIAMFPLPVLTGIGHSTNETVSEMVSFKSSITPTGLADFLISKFDEFNDMVNEFSNTVIKYAGETIADQKLLLANEIRVMVNAAKHFVLAQKNLQRETATALITRSASMSDKQDWLLSSNRDLLKRVSSGFLFQTSRSVSDHHQLLQRVCGDMSLRSLHKLEQLETTVKNLDPAAVFRRGFSVTTANGKVVKSINDIENGQTIVTMFADGKTESTVDHIYPEHL